jgi:hypothetical protein
MQRSTIPVADENDPVMTLRVHSNTYDFNGTPIFSVLTMRASQKFGPRLEYYCQLRNKQYGVDWVFIYRYAIGGPGDDARKRYIKIDYDMTCMDVRDPERPDIKLRDMDTIMIMKAKSRLAVMIENSRNGVEAPPSPIGSQVSEEDVDIIDGETPIFQNAGTITIWNRLVEKKMMELRSQVMALTTQNQRQRTTLAKQTAVLADVVERHNALVKEKNARAAGCDAQAFPSTSLSAANYHLGSQRGPTVQRNAFMDRLESVREPTVQNASQNRVQQFQFPTHSRDTQGRRPTYDSGEREAFPDFQRISAPSMRSAQFPRYGMGGNMGSHISIQPRVQPRVQESDGYIDDPVMKTEDAEMEE